MLKVLVSNARHFVSGFWRNEVSQMTKVSIMGLGSLLAVLSMAMLPPSAQAYPCPCSPCSPPNDPISPCPKDPNCQHTHWAACSGTTCDNPTSQLMHQCVGQNWECGDCPSGH